MKYVSLLLMSFAFISCAQMDKKLNMAMYGDKYEKTLPYKEGDIIEIKVTQSEYFDAYSSKNIKKVQVVNRFGYQGRNVLEVEKMTFPDYGGFFPNEDSEFRGYISQGQLLPTEEAVMKVKIISVARDCETEEVMGKTGCKNRYSDSYADFLDKAQFVSWNEVVMKKAASFLAMKKKQKTSQDKVSSSLARVQNVKLNRQSNPQYAKKCDSNLDKISSDLKSIQTEKKLKTYIRQNASVVKGVTECAASYFYDEQQEGRLPLVLVREISQQRVNKEDEIVDSVAR